MARKHSSPKRDAEPPRIDDLKQINGIGPAVEKRLNGVGIFAFPQLAALSPADIAAAVADLAGLSAERIIKQDWIGQARRLAASLPASAAQQDIITAVDTVPPGEERAPAAKKQAEPEQPGELAMESLAIPTQEDIVTGVETPIKEERAPATTQREEPEQPGEPAAESPADAAREDVEAPAPTEQIVTHPAPFEPPPAPVENADEAAPLAEPEMAALPAEEDYQPVTFTVELLLDENNNVYSTRALHIQSGREQAWMGWQKTDLIDFLSDSAGLNTIIEEEEPLLPGTKASAHTSVVATDNRHLPLIAESPVLAGTLRMRDIETLRAGSNRPSRLLASNEPFDVRLTLDLIELQVPANTSLNYKASIFGKSRDTGNYAGLIGEARGTIISDDTATIHVKGNGLSEGIYQLAATVIIGLPDMELTPRPGATASIDGGRVQVY